jgi:hypothetical protein
LARAGSRILEAIPLDDRQLAIEICVIATNEIEPDDAYDLVLGVMQKGHLAPVLPLFAANRLAPSFAFLGNNAAGPDQLVGALGAGRVPMAFPALAATSMVR